MDLTFHGFSVSLLKDFASKIVKPYFKGNLNVAIKILMEKALNEESVASRALGVEVNGWNKVTSSPKRLRRKSRNNFKAVLGIEGSKKELYDNDKLVILNLKKGECIALIDSENNIWELLKNSKGCYNLRKLKRWRSTQDLTRPCDSCGKPVKGGVSYCPKCNIAFCFLMSLKANTQSG